MFIMTEDGTQAVNMDYVTDIVICGGTSEAVSQEHPYKITAKMSQGSERNIVLFSDPRRSVVLEMLKTYLQLIKN